MWSIDFYNIMSVLIILIWSSLVPQIMMKFNILFGGDARDDLLGGEGQLKHHYLTNRYSSYQRT